MVIFSFGMCIVSFAIGFSTGWTLTLALLAMGPFMVIGLGLFIASLTSGMANVVRSYGQSAGYAEQALSSIRVVISYGMEMAEIENYNTYLVKSRTVALKEGVKASVMLGFLFLAIYGSYAYAFYIGSIWVGNPNYNENVGRNYTPGDVVVAFFTVLIGFFALAGVGENFKIIA